MVSDGRQIDTPANPCDMNATWEGKMLRIATVPLIFLALSAPANAYFVSSSRLWEWCQQGISLGYNLGAHDGFEMGQALGERAALCTEGMTGAEFDAMICDYLEDFPESRDDGTALNVIVAASVMTGPSCPS
jgi:hypothetical protein